MAGAGGLVAARLDINSRFAQSIVIAIVGVLMIIYVLIGGMAGTTWVQIIKAVLLIAGAGFMTVLVLAKFGMNISEILGRAQQMVSESATQGVSSRDVLAPGAQYGTSTTSKINLLSLGIALVLGTAGLPHVLMRFYTVPTAKEARRSVVWAIKPDQAYLFTLILGYGAARSGRPGHDPQGPRRAELRRPTAGIRTGWHDPARRDLRGGVRDDPCGGGRVDHHRVGVLRPRRVCQC